MPLTNAYRNVRHGVVQVLALNASNDVISSGSGSIIGDGKIVLTCAHCTTGGAFAGIVDPANPSRILRGRVIYHEQAIDIALIEFPSSVGQPVTMANSTSCAVGNGAFVVGYPMGVSEQVLLSAHISSISNDSLRIDASVNHGNSGGPLFNMNGEQIGVVNAKHGSLSAYLSQVENARSGATLIVGGVNPVSAIQSLIREMRKNLNLGIGYAIPTARIKSLHTTLSNAIP